MLPDYAEFEQAIGLDWYAVDPNLALLLDRLLPEADDRAFAEEHVAQFGRLVGGAIARRAEETDKNGPVLRRYDRWGLEIDEVVHHPTWLANKADLVRAGFVGLPVHAGRNVPAVVTASISYLVSQAETAIYCALGMTSGAADIVERYAPLPVRDEILRRLTSLDPHESWEGGMFLTERQGGSDVGANTCRAVQDGDEWRIFGDKHFCSNVDADVFIILARPEGAPAGSRGLATFIVPRHLPDGSTNGFLIKRLKPKLGTVGVPTGEVTLEGAVAWLAGPQPKPASDGAAEPVLAESALSESEPALSESSEPGEQALDAARDGRGINRMMEMVNGSRFGVSLMSLGIHRRSFLEAAIYAVATATVRSSHRQLSARSRDARRPSGRSRSGTCADLRVRCLQPAGGFRRGGGQVPPHRHPPRQDAQLPYRSGGGDEGARDARRQRLHGGLADGPPAAGCAVPHDLGGN